MIIRLIQTIVFFLALGAVTLYAQKPADGGAGMAMPSTAAAAAPAEPAKADGPYLTPTVYDPKRDAAADISTAVIEARRSGKRVMVEVGGEWCKWCHYLDAFFAANPDLLKLREANFVMVKVNFSEENENKELLSKYPAVAGYPHIFILERDGTLLHSQDTGELEDGKSSYRLDKFTAFLTEWSPKRG